MGALRYSHPRWLHDAGCDELRCPLCQGRLLRRRRRARDRVLSVVMPVRRYACEVCAWSGLRRRPDTAEVTATPWSPVFVLCIAVVLLGTLAAIGLVIFELVPGLGLEIQRLVNSE